MTDTDRALLCDAMLGSLARLLRMCGYDTAYALDRGLEADDAVAALARREGRVLLTRDHELAARVDGAVRLDARDVDAQLAELDAAGFTLSLDEPARCGACNGPLAALEAGATRPEHAPADRPLWRCRDCGKHFWRGSHWTAVAERLP